MFVFAYVLPLSVISCCYKLIFTSVARHNQQVIKENEMNSLNIQQRETQLARVVITTVGFWIMAWTPYAVVSLLGVFSWRGALTPVSTMLPAVFAKLSTVCNPFIYAVSHPRYRQELSHRLPWLCCRVEVLPRVVSSRQRPFTSNFSHTPSFRSSRKDKDLMDLPSPDDLAIFLEKKTVNRVTSTDL
ncbi:Opsin-like, partial [Homarus americanus]